MIEGWSDDAVVRLLDHAPDPVLVVDDAGLVRYAGGPVSALLGRPRSSLPGRRLVELLPGWRRPETEGQHWSSSADAVHADGGTVPVECWLAPVSEELTGVFLRDLRGRLALERENDRVRDDLASNISHELRTPLTSVIGYTELLRELPEDQLGPMARRLVDIVQRNARRELLLVEDLLAVSFTDRHLARMVDHRIDLGEVAAQVVEERGRYAEAAGITLHLDADGPATVRGDAHHLARVVHHLVTNGCKFSPPGSEVRVSIAAEEATVLLTVTDDGIGISQREADRVFERLYRAPGAIERLSEGSGLGLAVARSVVEAHRGTIRLDSVEGAGTTVRVVLPRADA